MTMLVSRPSKRRTRSGGFIIVAVLWILGALSALVSIYSVYAINTAAGFGPYENRIQAQVAVSAALELTAYRLLSGPALVRPTRGEFSFRLGHANVDVTFCSEAARIDLNKAPVQLLAGLFRALGSHADDADRFSQRVVAWRTPLPNAGTTEPTGVSDRPRTANFASAHELAAVSKLPLALVERSLPFLTVYSGREQVNVADAAAEVIAALPGMTPERVAAFLAQRTAAPDKKQDMLKTLGAAQQYSTTEGSRAYRLQTRIAFDNGGREHAEVVILLFDQGNEPFSILSWRDQFDDLRFDSGPRTRI
jgi:general secretion pathway protein K